MNDQFETYQYDAEGGVKSSTCISGCGSQYVTYNALGQRVQDYQSDSLGGYMTLTYPRDIFGDRTGIWDDRPSQNWLGWDIFWSRVAGQRLNMGGSSAFIDHADAIGSTTMETDPSGAVDWDVVNGPWGQAWQQTGTRQSAVFAGMDWQVNDPLMPSATREYSDGLGRWMTPDPGGTKVVSLANPQTWNMYAYVTDNPTTLNDPSGLQSNCEANVNINGPAGGHCSPNDELVEEAAVNGRDARQGVPGVNSEHEPSKNGPYIAKDPQKYMGKCVGSGQCVAFVEADTGAPPDREWAPGTKVGPDTPKGAAIATFGPNGKYQNIPGQSHAAELVSISPDGKSAVIRDQYKTRSGQQVVHTRTIHDRGGHGLPVNDLSRYRIIIMREEDQ